MHTMLDRALNNYSVNATAFKTAWYYNSFRKTYKFLKKSQWWGRERLEAYQLQELRTLLSHAYANVPFYKELFDSLQLKPTDIKELADLQKLPFLTKDLIREHLGEIKAKNYPESSFELTRTGGSTGYPLQFYKQKGVWLTRLMAYTKVLMGWAGCSFLDRSVFITGRTEPWKYQLFGRMLVLSSFYMNEEHLPDFIQKIKAVQPKYILTYPSAITLLATYVNNHKIDKFLGVKTVICHAETLYEWQRKLIEDTFQCNVHNHYGLREQAALGGTCEYNSFHLFPQYGITELIDGKGNPVTKEGEVGEIVGTGFHTYHFPFIRYRTGDLGVYTTEKCRCGRAFPVVKEIKGRVQDFVVSKTHALVPLTRIHHLVAESSQQVKACQFYQDTEGELVLRLVVAPRYTDADSKKIHKEFHKILGDGFTLTICIIDCIPLTNRGKFQFLVQKLPLNSYR